MRWHQRGILVRGQPGSGKSALVAELLLAGATLVADDLLLLDCREDGLTARAVLEGDGSGLIEVRAGGIYRLVSMEATRLHCCVDLAAPGEPCPRLPGAATILVHGRPLIHLRIAADGPLAPRILMALTAVRAG